MQEYKDLTDSQSVALVWGRTDGNLQGFTVTFDESTMLDLAENLVSIHNSVDEALVELRRRYPCDVIGCENIFVTRKIGELVRKPVYEPKTGRFLEYEEGICFNNQKIPEHLAYTGPVYKNFASKSWSNDCFKVSTRPIFISDNEEWLKSAVKRCNGSILIADPKVADRAGLHVLSNIDPVTNMYVCTSNLRGLRTKTTKRFNKCKAWAKRQPRGVYELDKLFETQLRSLDRWNQFVATIESRSFYEPPSRYHDPYSARALTCRRLVLPIHKLENVHQYHIDQKTTQSVMWLDPINTFLRDLDHNRSNRLLRRLQSQHRRHYLMCRRTLAALAGPIGYLVSNYWTLDFTPGEPLLRNPRISSIHKSLYRCYLTELRAYGVRFPREAFHERKQTDDQLAERIFERFEPDLAAFRRSDGKR